MRCVKVVLCLLAISAVARAQSDRGTITGTVSDPAGAVVASAPIQARNTQTGVLYESATSTTGNYTLVQLPAGTYEVTVSVPGFKTYTRSGLQVQVAQTIRIDIALEVGSSAESITVTEAAPLLKTESGELSHNVAVGEMNSLPILGIGGAAAGTQGIRNPNAVSLLIPGVYWSANADLRVNGAPNNTQSYRIEGQEAMNTGTPGTPGQNQPSVDAIQELAVQTSNFAAEFGQVGGGVFNLTMRSGTNQYHGSGYDYYVNEFLNAGNPYTDNGRGGNTRQTQRRNDYGFTIGGPVWAPKIYNGRDKTFFFVNWEQFRENQKVNNQLQTVATPAYKAGNFAQAITTRGVGNDPLGRPMLEGMVFDPNTARTVNGAQVRDQFPGNQIPVARFDPVAARIQSLFPNPQGINAGGLVNNYINLYVSKRVSTIPSVKIDQSIGAKTKLSFFWQRTQTTNPNGNPTLGQSDGLPGHLTTSLGTFTKAPLYRLNFDYSLTPTLLLHLGGGYRATYFRTPAVTPEGNIVYDQDPFDAEKEVGLKGLPLKRFLPRFTGLLSSAGNGGMKDFGGTAAGAPVTTQSPTFNANLTWVRQNHTYKYGGEFRTENYYAGGPGNDGTFTTAASLTGQPFQNTGVAGANVGFGYASFLLGQISSVTIGGPVSPRTGKKQLGLFAQDTWKVTRRFTMDYGLRYDYSTYLQEQYGRAPTFRTNVIHPLAGIPGAAVYDGTGPKQCNCNIAKNYPWAFGPRLGAAYQINSKTVLRLGFGIVYSGTEQNNNATGGLAASTRTSNNPTFGSPVLILAQGLTPSYFPPVWPLYDAAFFPTAFPTPGAGPTMMDPNAGRPGRQYQWSIGIQREISRDMVVDVTYVGNRGIWWQAPGLINFNAISFDRLKAYGLDINNAADRTLLISFLNSPTAAARGFNRPPYPGFPLTQTVAQSLRPFPQFTTIANAWAPLGNSWYDSLQVKATKRLSHGLTFTSTFTWQKSLATGSEREPNFGSGLEASSDNDVFNRKLNKYISRYSQPLTFLTSIQYQTPRFGGNKLVSLLVQDWSIGAFLAYRSGLPIQAPAGVGTPNILNLVFQDTYANRVPGQPLYETNWVDYNGKVHNEPLDINCHCFDPQKVFALNRAAWAVPAPGQFGTAAAFYDDYRFQRRPQENFNFGRTFRIKERVSFNIRAEFTNIFNRAFIGNPASTDFVINRTFQANGNTQSGFGSMLQTATQQPRNGLIVGRIQF
jgi:hypothetical protein